MMFRRKFAKVLETTTPQESMAREGTSDDAWVRWGEHDPYFAVITDPKFRVANLNAEAKGEFFDSGRYHVHYVLETINRHVRSSFIPSRVLDFGCGVGRVTIPFAERASEVVGIDVSPAMLAEAQSNAMQMGRDNVRWALSDDQLSAEQGTFDLVHSCITFQHIDMRRGRRLFELLVDRVAPGGVGAIQITYAKAYHPDTYGQPQVTSIHHGSAAAAHVPGTDPEMQMNVYSLSELAFLLQRAGVSQFHTTFTDHGGEWGVFLFFGR